MATISDRFVGLMKEQEKIDGLIEGVAMEVFRRIYDRTPVDTGYAQSRWTVDVNADGFTVSNDAPYISFLEDGHSQQAPHGMVAVTINEIDTIVTEQARRLAK